VTRRAMRTLIMGLCAVALTPALATAQAHMQLLGGLTETAERHPFFGAALGLRLGAIEFDVEGGRFSDILAKGVLDGLNQLQQDRGLPVQGIASVPATYALASLRVIPGVGPVRPFISGGVGLARMTPRIDVVIEGISFGDVFGLTSLGAYTEPMAALGAGLRIEAGKVHVEGGYRYIEIFSDFRTLNFSANTTHTRVHSVYGAVGVGF
jgi:hypothetical protein